MTQRKRLVSPATVCVVVLLLAACSKTKELVVLLPGEDGKPGSVTIAHGDRTVVLDEPLSAAKIDTQGRVKKEAVTPDEIERTFASTLAAHPPAPRRFILYYDAANIEITAESQLTLEALLAEMAKRSSVEVEITGHTDRVGQVEDNDRLALMRAQTIRDKLIQLGLHADFVRAVGRGEREPLVATPDEQPEPRNRRVEVIVR
jgi:outer membrane protein OmpA-like peptidoglycan-associated protein